MANSIFIYPGGITFTGGGSISPGASGQFLAQDGTVSLPGYAFLNDPDTGFRSISNGIIGIISNGADVCSIQSSGFNIPSGSFFRSSQFGTKIQMPADGQIVFLDNAGTSFSLLNFGGTTSAFPALKRSGAAFLVRLGDDSADGSLQAATLTASSKVFVGTANVAATAPTIASGFGTSPSIVVGGVGFAFRV